MLDSNTRIKTYSQSSLKQRYFFSDNEKGLLLNSIAQKYDLHKDEVYKKFAITVGDIILGFYRTEDTVPLLQQELGIDPRTAALLGADVLDFLAPLSDPNWQPPAEEGDVDEDQSDDNYPLPITTTSEEVLPTIPTNPIPQLDGSPSTPTDILDTKTPTGVAGEQQSQVPPPNPALHTMATDMQQARQTTKPTPTLNLDSEPSYQAQPQSSLRQPLSDTPTYTPPPNPITPLTPHDPEPPRWSSQ